MCSKSFIIFTCLWTLTGLCSGKSALYSEESPSSIRIEQCHDGCIKKFSADDTSCLQAPECASCWDDCADAQRINKSIAATWTLGVTSMVRENSLVSANIAWESSVLSPSDCLVTWEVSGGGLIGNLLTQSANVELSLWPDTKYRVQVTCKNKNTEEISRSLPLTLDTSNAIIMTRSGTASPSSETIRRTSSENDITSNVLMYEQPQMQLTRISFESFTAFDWFFCIGIFIMMLISLICIIFHCIVKRALASEKESLMENEVSVNVDVERLTTIHV